MEVVGANRMAMLDDNPLVTCRDVTKVYGSGNAEVHALRGVDLDVYAGELTMLVGPAAAARRRCSRCSRESCGRPPARSTRWAPS